MSLLRVDDLTLRFGGLTAVNKLSFEVTPGQIYAIIGPNGAGKTSAFNAITGVYVPACGCVRIRGREAKRPFTRRTLWGFLLVAALTAAGLVLAVNAEPLWEAAITMNYLYQQPFPWAKALQDGLTYLRDVEWKYSAGAAGFGALVGLAGAWSVWRRARCAPDVLAGAGVARTFQNSRLFHQMTVLDNVLVGMDTKLRTRFWHAAFRLPRHRRELRESSRKALEILRFAGLEKEATAVASSLSYGHQRRLEIARALAVEPVILLLDEPAAGMNPTEAAGLMELIRRIRGRGIAVLLIEHHMKVVMGVSDEIAVLEYGNKIAEGKPEAIKIDPKVRAAYLGTAEV